MARHPPRRALALIDLLAVIAILTTLMGLSLKALQKVRESSTRLACQSNMRQLGQALLHYHDQKKYFPPSQDGAGNNATTWLKLILPYVGYESSRPEDPVPLYVCPADRDARSLVFKGTVSAAPAKFTTKTCDTGLAPTSPLLATATPSSTSSTGITYACSSYVAVVSSKNVNGPYDAVMYPRSRTRAGDISDGLSNTVIVGERPPSKDLVWGWWASPFRGDITMGTANTYRLPIMAAALPGAAPTLCPAVPYFGPGSLENPCDTEHFWSFHPMGSNWLFADGSVHFIQYGAALQVPKMATRAGSEVIDWLDVF